MLEDLLHIQANNQDLPDAGRWELKYTSHTSYMALFHNDPLPRKPSVIAALVDSFGWRNKSGQTAFRHTIWGRSKRGFAIKVDPEKVTVRNDKRKDIVPSWEINDLINASATKLRNLLVIVGKTDKVNGHRFVQFNEATAYSQFRFTRFIDGLRGGWVCIDFDARTNDTGGIRNHGTKFRIKAKDLRLPYVESLRIKP